MDKTEKLTDAAEILRFIAERLGETRDSFSWLEDNISLEGKTGSRVMLRQLDLVFIEIAKALPHLMRAHAMAADAEETCRKVEIMLDVIEGRIEL